MTFKKKALFLDRDGVINKNYGYVNEKSQFEFFPEIFEIMHLAQSLDMPIIIVTNQSGIGRGYFSELDFSELTKWMNEELLKKGIRITSVFYSAENPDGPEFKFESTRRKPSPSMFEEANELFDLDLAASVMIGDNDSDMEAANAAGIGHRILISNTVSSIHATIACTNHVECFKKVSEIYK